MDQSRINGLPATVNFLHIPKTAGITFNNLTGHFISRGGDLCQRGISINRRLKRGEQFDNTPIKYFRAHLQYAPYFFTKPVNYVTMLREPVKQVVSSVKQMIRSK